MPKDLYPLTFNFCAIYLQIPGYYAASSNIGHQQQVKERRAKTEELSQGITFTFHRLSQVYNKVKEMSHKSNVHVRDVSILI